MERKTIGYERISHLVERQYEQEMAMRKELEEEIIPQSIRMWW